MGVVGREREKKGCKRLVFSLGGADQQRVTELKKKLTTNKRQPSANPAPNPPDPPDPPDPPNSAK
jgi:hypothetical protein